MNFTDQTAVVTGGTRGLGRAITLALLEAGASVHATWIGNEEAAAALTDAAAPFAGRLHLHRFDVSDEAAVEAFWEKMQALPDGVQVLVNNAGLRRDAIAPMMSSADWQAVLDTNLTGGWLMSRGAVKNMMGQRYGRIIFITSPAGNHGFAGQTNYGASKAGQIGLARSLCKEVAKRGITVNCVSPGFVDTELLDDLPEDVRKAHLASVPQRRFGKPEEIAYAVMTLAAREASYINGATLEVTGGL
ncbi:MAG: 3-oxoacyl-ACP reductase FabG [Planctomycetota bacterium]|jgi:3-oxoacyl-[acyl-carrier protein] reductase|nr:beta-ketoacyl-ACP reductase [Planctomycetota bacterium]MDP6369823.1 3-oxoacyl-ACP reductase FabG [Planctomycetota bacterium]MDP6518510.1 3-oxoacyl-ACP reductase FabG [Planctomycetota bacterium]MDP6838936.1 3-oxoacyl-ACP reductase FabG [Planctomycetota bacterium]